MSITKLPGKWRKRGEGGSQDGRTWGYNAACDELSTELEAALPKWVKASSTDTLWLPEDGAECLIVAKTGASFMAEYDWKNEIFFVDDDLWWDYDEVSAYRLACDLDFPPEEKT